LHTSHQQGWSGHHDELEGPQADLGDGEEVVEAHVLTARLLGVADKVIVLVLPDLLSSRHVHQDAEDEDDGEPDAADDCGVLVHPTQDAKPILRTLLCSDKYNIERKYNN
uniref:Uncharacterized protein n=1 Tax=Oncorhynchus kisutch TaxID=8019 RepID=A0A8C7CHS3_ONCKI